MDMKRLSRYVLGLYGAMFDDIALEFPALRADFRRDYKRLCSAVDTHGIQFALIDMPDYRKHLDKCLDNGRLTKSGLTHFGSYRSRGVIPRLFKGLHLLVFDDNGELRSIPDVRAIFWLRQLLGAVRKLKLECSDSSTWEQVDEFIKIDAAVRIPSSNWDDPTDTSHRLRDYRLSDILGHARCEGAWFGSVTGLAIDGQWGVLDVIQDVADYLVGHFGVFNPLEWRARHGPGAVADHNGSYKYDFVHWSAKLESVFPYDVYGIHSHSALGYSDTEQGPFSEVYFRHEPAARLIAVPKSLKAPRLIAAEPTSHQWCQQIIRDYLMTRTTHTMLGQFVAFRRQDLSQEMVRRASITGYLATADLSSASDRLSCYVVERIFRSRPELVNAFKAVRTRWMTQSLDKHQLRAIRLKKFSTMGSALTFPVQSIVFACIALGVTLYHQRKSVYTGLSDLRGSVRVFGDDIIVPKDCLDLLGNTLEVLGLKINAKKTFGTGMFRESCGEDAYAGHTVTTININEFPRKSAPGAVLSCVDVHNNLYNRGLVYTASYIKKTVEQLGYKFPIVPPASGALGWNDDRGYDYTGLKTRWNRLLHRHEVRSHTAKAVVARTLPGGYGGVLQYFTEAPKEVMSSVSSHGFNATRPKVKLTLGWAALPK